MKIFALLAFVSLVGCGMDHHHRVDGKIQVEVDGEVEFRLRLFRDRLIAKIDEKCERQSDELYECVREIILGTEENSQ